VKTLDSLPGGVWQGLLPHAYELIASSFASCQRHTQLWRQAPWASWILIPPGS